MAHYQNTQHIGELIMNRYVELTSAKEIILATKAEDFSKVWQMSLFIMITFIFCLCTIIALIGFHFIKETISPIISLTKITEKFADGELDFDKSFQTSTLKNNETKVLAMSFQKMAATIRNQMEELKEKIALDEKMHQLEMGNMQMQVSLAKTETMFTQSLVNPHFLFNCITLASLAYSENAPKTRKTAILIAQFLRKSLSRVGKEITVKEELEHLQQYIEIQKIRFEDRIAFSLTCDDNCNTAIIPAMIIQPLVENSIIHGVGSYIENAHIDIDVRLGNNDTVVFRIMDDGVGMSQEKIEEVLKNSNREFSKRNQSFGLQSILARLHKAYGEDGQFTIESQLEKTIVTVELPFRTN